MNLQNTMAAFISAVFLALVAYLIELSTHLPEPIAYFAIALLAASLTLALSARLARRSGNKGKAKSSPKATPASNRNDDKDKELGNVKWFSASKGFGFITRDNGEDIFVHFRSIDGSGHRVLREGQRVQFAVTEGDKGLQAEDVVPVK